MNSIIETRKMNFKKTPLFSYVLVYRKRGGSENCLKKILKWLEDNKTYNFEIILVEQDSQSTIDFLLPKNCKHIFVFNDSSFNKGWACNIGAKAATTNILVYADCDIIMRFKDLYECVLACKTYDAIDPKKQLLDLEENEEPFISKKKSVRLDVDFCSAIFLIKKSSFFYLNGFDEDFVGWGADDNLFSHKIRTILRFKKLAFDTYHLYHTSEGYERKTSDENRKMLEDAWKMDKHKLLEFYSKHDIADINKYKNRKDIQINFNARQVSDLVIESLKNQKPLFVLRIGDGEMLYFGQDRNRMNMHCEQQLGYMLSDFEIEQVKNSINQSILCADILGLPTTYHKRSSVYWKNIEDYYIELKSKNPENWKCSKFCTIDVHYELLYEDCYDKIFKETKKLFIVSSRDVKEKINLKYPNIEQIEQHLISGEQAYETVKNTSRNFIKQIQDIESIIKSKSRQGELFLYGAGFVGKILGCDFSSSGGVAIDIGSVFDSWVGKDTRSPNKGPEAYIKPLL